MHMIVDSFWKGRNRFPKKAIGQYFDDLKKPKACCHLGAINYGTFNKTSDNVIPLIEMFPELRKVVPMPCDDLLEPDGWISSILVHLSDIHTKRDWPDEKIASWLEESLA